MLRDNQHQLIKEIITDNYNGEDGFLIKIKGYHFYHKFLLLKDIYKPGNTVLNNLLSSDHKENRILAFNIIKNEIL